MTVPATRFPLASDTLAAVAGGVLREAKAAGATAAETEVSQGFGQSVTVRKGDVETIAYNRDKGIGVTVYVGARCASPLAGRLRSRSRGLQTSGRSRTSRRVASHRPLRQSPHSRCRDGSSRIRR